MQLPLTNSARSEQSGGHSMPADLTRSHLALAPKLVTPGQPSVVLASVIWRPAPATVEALLAVALTASMSHAGSIGVACEPADASSDLLQGLH